MASFWIAGMSFGTPWGLLVAAGIVAAFAVLYRRLEGRKRANALRYSNLAFVLAATQSRPLFTRLLAAAWLAAVLLVALALADPRVHLWLPAKDGAVVLCIDTSGSMAATDVTPNRAAAAKNAAVAFIDHVSGGTKVGIIAFSSTAAVVQPVTPDLAAVTAALDQVPMSNGATAVGDALLLAGKTLPQRGHRVVVLITDGVSNRGEDPLAASQVLAAQGVRLFTVGIGTNGEAIIPGTNEQARIDEDALRAYASAANGAYSRAGSAGALREILAALGRTTTLEVKQVRVSAAFAFVGGFLMITAFLIGMAAGRYP